MIPLAHYNHVYLQIMFFIKDTGVPDQPQLTPDKDTMYNLRTSMPPNPTVRRDLPVLAHISLSVHSFSFPEPSILGRRR